MEVAPAAAPVAAPPVAEAAPAVVPTVETPPAGVAPTVHDGPRRDARPVAQGDGRVAETGHLNAGPDALPDGLLHDRSQALRRDR